MLCTLSVVTPCFNEEENIHELYNRTKVILDEIGYDYEFIFIDNASTDNTVAIIKSLIIKDPNVKLIVNMRNFGHIRSPYYALLQTKGDAVILLSSDLQDPPELIKDFINAWKNGFDVVAGVKTLSEESSLFFTIRKMYYKTCNKIANIELIENFTGFGLYDKKVIAEFRKIKDNYPYLRGLIQELGFNVAKISFKQPIRKRGLTKNNFYTLYDIGMLGIISHSKIPLRIAVILGFICSGVSLCISCVYLILKILFWSSFQLGMAPVLISLFFFSSIQLFFIGMLGEYILAIHTSTLDRPLIVEKERINF